ncbi:hypothetical protein BGY98DRAFT_270526 [Russula aff. rugulosa BPL654]|nr:hypothetical protein BGY98DRAFT_270526 [Russula aff. rugulosa BPL654]
MVDPLIVMKVWLIRSITYSSHFSNRSWEFVSTLDYEWSVIRGHQRYRWTIWIYSIARLSGLMTVCNTLVNFNLTTEINCQAWLVFGSVIATLGCYGLGSILIILRIFAIWERNKVIMAITIVIFVSNISYQLSGVVNTRAVWDPATKSCLRLGLTDVKGLALGALITDTSLLLIMLAGLLRLRQRDGSFHDLAYILWKQGAMWLAIAAASQFPQVLTLFLNVNVAYKEIFFIPAVITIVIAGTRMYRDLTYYGSTPPNTTYDILSLSMLAVL